MKIPSYLDNASLICPITGQMIRDPVIDHEGNSYEKTAILRWISQHEGISPITRNPLRADQLVPNRALQELIQQQQDANATVTTAKSSEGGLSLSSQGSACVAASVVASKKVHQHTLLQLSVADLTTPPLDNNSNNAPPPLVICVLDTSGSMATAAVMHGDAEGSAGLSLLDIVKHATRTEMETLSKAANGRIAVIAYSNDARVILPPTVMTEATKTEAWNKVKELRASGGTNLWGGLLEAMKMAAHQDNASNTHIILLTDGQPNISPPRGEVDTYKRFKEQLFTGRSAPPTLSTFGFGYNIKSVLLRDLAQCGKGHYCFIPDSSFVGTVFVNATANLLATAVPSGSKLAVSCPPGVSLEDCSYLDGCKMVGENTILFELPSIIYGQTLDILFKTTCKDLITVTLKDTNGRNLISETTARHCDAALAVALTRHNIVDFVMSAERKLASTSGYDNGNFSLIAKELENLLRKLPTNSLESDTTAIQSLLADAGGQITEAYSRSDWHKRWGRHYLLSLMRAHVVQQCTNFKDAGLQNYTTDLFCHYRDISEDLFVQLPPPTPSRRSTTTSHSPVSSMRTYYDVATPCFAAGTIVMVVQENGDRIKRDISELKAGDVVVANGGATARIQCMVKTVLCNEAMELVELDQVRVTPWHPVRPRGSNMWFFPCDLSTTKWVHCSAVYSFVLDGQSSSIQVGESYDGIALGHGIQNDAVAMHDYFGTQSVIEDLKQLPGWTDGLVILSHAVRNPKTGLIEGVVGCDKKSVLSDDSLPC